MNSIERGVCLVYCWVMKLDNERWPTMNNKQVMDYLQQHHAEFDAEGDVIINHGVPSAALLSGQATHAFLTQYAVLCIRGDDAEAFLQSQFSSDVKALNGDGVQWSSYSNAKGRMQASFLLWRIDAVFFLMIRRDIAELFRRRLSMFIMRSKVTVEPLESAVLLGEYQANSATDMASYSPALIVEGGASVRLNVGRNICIHYLNGEDCVLPLMPGALIGSREFDSYFIDAGVPWVSAATYEAFVPQMANMDLIGGISFRKGCYPGQEIVARTQYLGKVKRRMFIVEADGALCPVGCDVRTEATGDQGIGKVMSSILIGEKKYRALVVMQISAWENEPYLALESEVKLSRMEMPYSIPELLEG